MPLFVFLLATAAMAQSGTVPASCGPAGAKFQIKTPPAPVSVQTEPGMAVVYFIADDEGSFVEPTTLAGVDGKWVGATHGSSWLYFRVDPGVHHLCALTNSGGTITEALAHFTAEPGAVYYFEAKDLIWTRVDQPWFDETLLPVDSDEGQLLLRTEDFSASHAK